jgi:(methylthio)acryloyl-CoA hydratase
MIRNPVYMESVALSHPPSPEVTGLPSSLLVQRHGAVAVLSLNRPAKRNALNDETLLGIERFFTHLPDDVACVVLTAEGDHFSAGLDLSEMDEHDTMSGVRHSRMWHRVLELVEFGPVPVVCALHGAVVGGGLELAAAAHVRVADRSAFYALPEGMRGLFVGGGASVRVPRLVGVARMADMMLTGRRYDAEEGLAIGLSQYVVEDGAALDRALELARRIAQNAPQTNFAVVQALPRIAEANPREGYFMEAMMAAIAQGTDEAKQRMRAFVEGRAQKVTDQ